MIPSVSWHPTAPRAAAAPPPKPRQEALDSLREAGYRVEELPVLTIRRQPPPSRDPMLQLLQTANPGEGVKVSGWDELRELVSVVTGVGEVRRPELARDLRELEAAGARMCVLEPINRPVEVGALGAYHLEQPLWLTPPDGDFPTRMDSLDAARWFVLQSGPEPGPGARELAELSRRGFGFLNQKQMSVGALGAYVALERGEEVKLSRGRHPVMPLQLGSERLKAVLDYLERHPQAEVGQLTAISLPGDLSEAERLELHALLHRAVDRPRRGEFTPLSGTSWAGSNPRAEQAARSARAGDIMARLGGHPETIRLAADLLGNGELRTPWVLGAAPYLLEHPEARDRLVELGELGGASFEESLRIDSMPPEARQAVLELAPEREWSGLGSLNYEDRQSQALASLEWLEKNRWSELSLGEDARLLGSLVQRFGHDEARAVRQQLEASQVETFLREHALCRDVPTALACLQPGGHPDLLEPLAVREEAAALIKRPPPVLDLDGPRVDSGYEFLLTLPGRALLEDARQLVALRQGLPEESARELLLLHKLGQLGGLEPGALLAMLTERLGEPRGEDLNALKAPLPEGATLEQGVRTLSLLHGVLPAPEARRAYTELLHSVREGAWAGHSLEEGMQRLAAQGVVGDFPSVMRALASPPLELAGGGVAQDARGVTVGGVRLRTRS